ncbi:MAG: hypothetical protein ACC645_13315 [Pirellulales bacterium]
MKRALAHDNSDAVSLFPFLAVLLCTMGALIVLLVVMARQARLQASSTEDAAASPPVDLAQQAAIVGYIDRLQQAQQTVAAGVDRDRQVLALQETRIRQLKEELVRLQATAAKLEASGKSTEELRRRDEDEVARLGRLIEDATEQLEATRRRIRQQGPKVAIIPYTGPRGTERRPIYIECQAESVTLQPEGIVLLGSDFLGPLGPGNPLAAALRAARQYHRDRASTVGTNQSSGEHADPYPLILVRPDGVSAYYRVRDAIASWGADFGYELIDADWEIAFSAADPELARIEQEAVEAARRRRAELSLAAPSRFGSNRWIVRASPRTGGFQRIGSWEDESGRAGGPGRGSFAARRRHRGGREATGGSPGYGGDRPSGSDHFAADGHGTHKLGSMGGAGSLSTPSGSRGSIGNARQAGLPQTTPYGSGTENGHGTGKGRGTESGRSAASARGGNDTWSGNGPETGGQAGSGQQSTRPGGTGAQGSAADGTDQGAASRPADGTAEFGNQPGGAGESLRTNAGRPQAGGASGRQSTGGSAGGSGSQGSSSATPGAPSGGGSASSAMSSFAATPQSARSMASQRGRNWALPDAGRRAVPITRPVKIVVRHDRLAILPDAPRSRTALREGATVPLDKRTEDAIDTFVSSLWDHVDTWGIAGNGLYWRPMLELYVAPGAQWRADELKELLEGSGLELVDRTGGAR